MQKAANGRTALVEYCIKQIWMSGSWNVEEMKVLIAILGQENVQSQLDRICSNCDVCQPIAMDLEDAGYVKTWQQCRTKIKNLSQKYRKANIYVTRNLVMAN